LWGEGGFALARLAAEAVQSTPLPLQSVHDVHGGDGLPLGVLRVRHGVTDHVLEEHLENSAGLLVDETRNSLHTATTGQATDGRLRDALDVVAEHLAVTLRAAFPETLSTLATSRHIAFFTERTQPLNTGNRERLTAAGRPRGPLPQP
jgi:hypothetical protein